MNLSDVIGKNVFDAHGRAFGFVYSVTLTKNLKKMRSLKIATPPDEDEIEIAFSSVAEIGEVIVVKNAAQPKGEFCDPPIGKKVFDGDAFSGCIQTIEFLGEDVTRICGVNFVFQIENVSRYGDVFIKKSEKNKVFSLIGKTVRRDVVKDGKTIIFQGTVITKSVIKTAEDNDRLIQLAANSI